MTDQYPGRLVKERYTTRKLPDTILEVTEEVVTAVRQRIITKSNGELPPGELSVCACGHERRRADVHTPYTADWTSVLVFPTMRHIVARASNRAFVGLPMCTSYYARPGCHIAHHLPG